MGFTTFILLAFLCGLGLALPVKVPGNESKSEQADIASATHDKKPDLDTIINTINGGSEIQKIARLLQEFQIAKDAIQKYIAVSPLMKSIIDKTAKRNVKMDILLKVMEGDMPDLHDIYKMATTKSNAINTDIDIVEKNSSDWRKFSSLIGEKNVMSSNEKVEEVIYLLTDKKVDVKSSLLKKLRTNRYRLSKSDDVAHVNLIQTMFFVVDNWHLLSVVGNNLAHGNVDYLKQLQTFKKMDWSHLQLVLAPPQSLGSGHYAVATHWTGRRDPDVLQIMKDLSVAPSRTDPQAQSKAETAVFDIVKRIFSISSKALEWVEAEAKSPETKSSESNETDD